MFTKNITLVNIIALVNTNTFNKTLYVKYVNGLSSLPNCEAMNNWISK